MTTMEKLGGDTSGASNNLWAEMTTGQETMRRAGNGLSLKESLLRDFAPDTEAHQAQKNNQDKGIEAFRTGLSSSIDGVLPKRSEVNRSGSFKEDLQTSLQEYEAIRREFGAQAKKEDSETIKAEYEKSMRRLAERIEYLDSLKEEPALEPEAQAEEPSEAEALAPADLALKAAEAVEASEATQALDAEEKSLKQESLEVDKQIEAIQARLRIVGVNIDISGFRDKMARDLAREDYAAEVKEAKGLRGFIKRTVGGLFKNAIEAKYAKELKSGERKFEMGDQELTLDEAIAMYKDELIQRAAENSETDQKVLDESTFSVNMRVRSLIKSFAMADESRFGSREEMKQYYETRISNALNSEFEDGRAGMNNIIDIAEQIREVVKDAREAKDLEKAGEQIGRVLSGFKIYNARFKDAEPTETAAPVEAEETETKPTKSKAKKTKARSDLSKARENIAKMKERKENIARVFGDNVELYEAKPGLIDEVEQGDDESPLRTSKTSTGELIQEFEDGRINIIPKSGVNELIKDVRAGIEQMAEDSAEEIGGKKNVEMLLHGGRLAEDLELKRQTEYRYRFGFPKNWMELSREDWEKALTSASSEKKHWVEKYSPEELKKMNIDPDNDLWNNLSDKEKEKVFRLSEKVQDHYKNLAKYQEWWKGLNEDEQAEIFNLFEQAKDYYYKNTGRRLPWDSYRFIDEKNEIDKENFRLKRYLETLQADSEEAIKKAAPQIGGKESVEKILAKDRFFNQEELANYEPKYQKYGDYFRAKIEDDNWWNSLSEKQQTEVVNTLGVEAYYQNLAEYENWWQGLSDGQRTNIINLYNQIETKYTRTTDYKPGFNSFEFLAEKARLAKNAEAAEE